MGHFVIFDDDNYIEVPGFFIRKVLQLLKSNASTVEVLSPLIGGANYDWNYSFKVLPIGDLDDDGIELFSKQLRSILDDLDKVSKNWNDAMLQNIFRSHGEELLAKIEAWKR